MPNIIPTSQYPSSQHNMLRQNNIHTTYSNLFKNSDITQDVRNHLKHVYMTLGFALFAAAVGSLIDVIYHLGGILTFFCTIGTLVWLFSEKDEQKRLGIFGLFALFKGMTIGPLISYSLKFDFGPTIIAKAFFGTAVVFACFSGCAIFSTRRSWLYLGGILSSALSLLFYLSFFNLFFASPMVSQVYLYLGLIMFVGYVVHDTQVIIEEAILGSRDYVRHSLELFINFVAIFVRLLSLLLRNEDSKRKSRG